MKNIFFRLFHCTIFIAAIILSTISINACSSHHTSSETTVIRRQPTDDDMISNNHVEVTKTEKVSEETHADERKGFFGIIGGIFEVIGDIIALPFRAVGAII